MIAAALTRLAMDAGVAAGLLYVLWVLVEVLVLEARPIAMVIFCPFCKSQHIDREEWAIRPHHEHLCEYCDLLFTPAPVDTVGVEEIHE